MIDYKTIFSILIFIFSLFLSWFILLVITPKFIKLARARGWIGKDMNKFKKNNVAELGGVPVFLGFSISILLSMILYYLISFDPYTFIDIRLFSLILLTMFLIMFVGFVDDILGWKKGISQWQHFILPIIFSVPMILVSIFYGLNTLYIPFIGIAYFGLFFAWVFVPLVITSATNAFNLLAGFNGLEAGLSIIIFSTISFISVIQGEITLLIILACWLGALIGFLKFNKYPSKIFPGDIVTLVSGSLAGISAIVLHMEFLIGFLVLLFVMEFFIKLFHNFKSECFAIPQKNETIKANSKGGSLTHLILRTGRFTEKKLVWTFYIIQIVISIATILFYFRLYYGLFI